MKLGERGEVEAEVLGGECQRAGLGVEGVDQRVDVRVEDDRQ